jgi:hypothetical protein
VISSLRLSILSAGCLLIVSAAASAAPPNYPPLYRDTTSYPPFRLTWNVSSDIKQARGVFPSPILPQQAALATEAGLFFTTDAGHTWMPLPEATAQKIGPINAVAFHPLLPGTFYIGSQTSGVWVTTDQGKTFTNIGTKAKGLASDTVIGLIVYTGDPSHQTLLAVHGGAAPGISRSHDSGATWDTVNTDYCFTRIVGGEGSMAEFYLTGATVKDPDIQSFYSCNAVGEFLLELIHDVSPTDLVYAPGIPIPYARDGVLYATTSDAGADSIGCSAFGDSHNVNRLPIKDADGWASVGATWGPSADILNVYLYDPTKAGLVVSSDNFATSHSASSGLPKSTLVKEGAVVRPNTNGTVFYNVMDGTLAIGRVPEEVPVVEVSPPAVELNAHDKKSWRELGLAFQKFTRDTGSPAAAAKALVQGVGDPLVAYKSHQITITAKLPLQPAPPTSVTVDMSRFGGTPAMPMYDDGKHNDGSAGDGVYGTTLAFLPEAHRPPYGVKDWRSSWPGRVALGVTATFADGHHTGAVAVETIYTEINDIKVWRDGAKVDTTTEGGVTVKALDNPREIHNGAVSLTIQAAAGKWTVHLKIPEPERDITSYEAVSFWLHAAGGTPPKEINMQLKDHPEFSDPTTTDPVPTLNGIVPGADDQRIVVPMSQLTGSSPNFQSDHLDEIIISGENTAPCTLVMTDLQVLAHYDKPNSPAAPPSPQPSSQ